MGIFDKWRRRKQPVVKSTPKSREILTSEGPTQTEKLEAVEMTIADGDVDSLLAEHQRLLQRRETLQTERFELTERLDRGELDPKEFRKQLMSMIQEASQVSESLRENAAKLIALGHPGVSY